MLKKILPLFLLLSTACSYSPLALKPAAVKVIQTQNIMVPPYWEISHLTLKPMLAYQTRFNGREIMAFNYRVRLPQSSQPNTIYNASILYSYKRQSLYLDLPFIFKGQICKIGTLSNKNSIQPIFGPLISDLKIEKDSEQNDILSFGLGNGYKLESPAAVGLN
jgi:hypothetical protein